MDLLISENRQRKNAIVLQLFLLNFALLIIVSLHGLINLGIGFTSYLFFVIANIIPLSAYIWFYYRRKDSNWIGYIPIFGQFVSTILLMVLIPAITSAFSSVYMIVLAGVFMRRDLLYTAISLALAADIFFIFSVPINISILSPQVITGVITWSMMTAITLLLIVGNDRKLMSRFSTLQKDTLNKAEQIKRLATTDTLTNLPNQLSVHEHLQNAIQRAAASNSRVCVIWLDVDNFQMINDSVGHATGDQYLRLFARQLVQALPPNIHLFRSGGDEFNLIMDVSRDDNQTKNIALTIWEACQSPILVAGVSFPLKVSMGIAVYPEHGKTAEKLLISADVAMHKAKTNGKNQFLFFDEMMTFDLLQKRKLEDALQDALTQNEFTLHYQKQVQVYSGDVKGYEALLRWQQPDGQYISPGDWIHIAEETGLIIPIGNWVLRTACQTAKKWQDSSHASFTISVNISALQLMQHDFAAQVLAILAETGLSPRHLVLELTETVLIQSIETSTNHLNLLRDKGVKIALDDFGKGFSSLSYMKQLPADIIKIDKSFIDHIEDSFVDRVIMESIVSLALRIDKEVVAEGVEKQEQLLILQNIGCDYVQGYYFSKPLPEHLAFNKQVEKEHLTVQSWD
ncbi:diguanylate cyclase (GGDEF) domain-containing protein [Paenibacillus sp. yr247]|uniref:putative bifunctional diguanylate cyclase/phosphodiesterase n=1 Tax=Paenibacillus sp. yr247 TaxID=1761880 RepID=UPI00088E1155|nr:GGDEF domain-containing phosphodiesterase [Paenibacillus sp. yr247]SDO00325.1 diguanylate cyclase (GGDEF) domain-containing protein [Paenibacillus sp. yr247]